MVLEAATIILKMDESVQGKIPKRGISSNVPGMDIKYFRGDVKHLSADKRMTDTELGECLKQARCSTKALTWGTIIE